MSRCAIPRLWAIRSTPPAAMQVGFAAPASLPPFRPVRSGQFCRYAGLKSFQALSTLLLSLLQDSGLPLGSPMAGVSLTSDAFFDPSPLLGALPPVPPLSLGGFDASLLLSSPPPTAAGLPGLPTAGSSGQLAGVFALPSAGFLSPLAGHPLPAPLPVPAAPWPLQPGPAAGAAAQGSRAASQPPGAEPAAAAAAISDFDSLIADLYAGVPPGAPPGSPGWLADLLAMPPTAGLAPPPGLPGSGAAQQAPGGPLSPQQAAQVRELRLQQTVAALPPPQPPPPASLQQALDMIAQQSGEKQGPGMALPQAAHAVQPLHLPGYPDQASLPCSCIQQ
ncbi:hypothetical protein ABPG75_010212 [Micractinium tetrahymenae]